MPGVNHEDPSIGFASSNLSNNLNPGFELPNGLGSLAVLAAANQMSIELELEGNIATYIKSNFTKPAFLEVHQHRELIRVNHDISYSFEVPNEW